MRNFASILPKSLICIFIFAFQGLFFQANAQWPTDEKELNYKDLVVSEILDSLSHEFKINFSYNADLQIFHEKRSLVKKTNLENALQCLFKNAEVESSIVDRQVIIFAILKPEKNKAIMEEKPLFKKISGIVKNSSTNEALSFASIGITGSSVSSVANNEGSFSLKIPKENFSDSLAISCIGFETRYFQVSSIPENDWTIELKEYATVINPVLVKPVTAESIIREMLARARFNYLRRNAMYSAFYREIISNENTSLSLSEALLDIAKAPYGSVFLNDQARIFRGRKQEDKTKLNKLNFKLEGGIYNSLRLDIIKEEASFLSLEGMVNYEYSYRKVIPFEGRNLHVIEFKNRKHVQDITYSGSLYIDVESKALVAAHFEMSPDGLKYARNYLIKKQPKKTNIKPVSASYITFYRYFNGRYYLHYTRAELIVKAKSDRLFINNKYNAIAELAITDIDTTKTVRFKWNSISKVNDIISEHLDNFDDSYWGNYNIISPGSKISQALDDFKTLKKNDTD